MADVSLRIRSDFAQAEKDFKSLNMTTAEASEAMKKFREEFKTEQIDKFIERNKLTATAVKATKGDVASLTSESRGLQREIETLIKKGLSPESEHIKKLQGEYIRTQSELERVSESTKKTTNSFKENLKIAGLLAVGYKAFQGVTGAIKSAVNAARELEDAEAAFTPLMGGAKEAQQLIKKLNVVAAETPFAFQDIQEASLTLLPAMNRDMGKTIDTFKMLGDVSGGNVQKLTSIVHGYTQSMLKGRVTTKELNTIAGAGIPIFQEVAKTMGFGAENMEEFYKTISRTRVSSDVLTETFKRMTSEGGMYFEGMIVASKTLSGAISVMEDSFTVLASMFGQAFLPYFKSAAIAITNVTGAIGVWISEGDNLENLIAGVGYALAGAAAGFTAYAIGSGLAATATGAVGVAFLAAAAKVKAFTLALAANPFTAIAVVITAVLIPALIYLYKNWDTLKFKIADFALGAKIKLMEVALVINEKVLGSINTLMKAMSKLPGMGDKFKNIIEGNEKTVQSMKKAIEIEKIKQLAIRTTGQAMAEEAKKEKAIQEAKAQGIQAGNDIIVKSEQARTEAVKNGLLEVITAEAENNRIRLENIVEFFEQRAELDGINAEERIEWMQEHFAIIQDMENLNREQKLLAETALRQALEKEQQKLTMARVEFAGMAISTTKNMLSDMLTVFQNAGAKARELAVVTKAVAIAEGMISSYMAYLRVLSDPFFTGRPWMRGIQAALTLGAGLANVAKIASTPIPSAQTGLSGYVVPETRSTQNDRAAVMAQGGETVNVTPRGEDANQTTDIRIQIEEETLFRVVQRGIRTGKINVSNRNLGAGVFV